LAISLGVSGFSSFDACASIGTNGTVSAIRSLPPSLGVTTSYRWGLALQGPGAFGPEAPTRKEPISADVAGIQFFQLRSVSKFRTQNQGVPPDYPRLRRDCKERGGY